ncbi:MAG: HAD family hydrolase [Bacteroidetes bacterium]|uniref:phosphoglycolate phosphatase n=1 Tax=Candidatus Cryptobacteroides gallistercoris TaxID=2840765 RepID=A0A940DRY1_9BACT|nr:HAD family hydrolase [Candidatus Cryptobacteroides gallistercoris]
MTELVIFDLDGTLLNTIEDLGNACNHALEMCGHPVHDMKEYNMLVGRGIYNLFRGALPEGHRTDTEVRRMKDFFIPWYDAHKCDRTRPYDGMPALLGTLEARGIKLGVASNKYQDGTEKLVRHFFPDLDFVRILGQREGMPIKPDPGIVDEIMRASGLTDKSKAVYVGDSDVDMLTGRNAGVRTVGVTWGFRSREELAGLEPWRIADTPQELEGYLLL